MRLERRKRVCRDGFPGGYSPSKLFTAGHLSTLPRKSIIKAMADETKNPYLPSSQKPVSLEPPKDIENLLKELPKIDPLPTSKGVGTPTPDVEAKPAAPLPKPPAPVLMPPKPQSPPLPKPIPPPASPPLAGSLQPPAPQSAKSFVRTMAEDLEAAKKGIKPEPKPFEIKPPPAIPKTAPAPPPLKMPPVPQIKLGPAEKTKSLELPKERPPLPPISPSIQKRKFTLSPKNLIIILALILAVFTGAWYFLTRKPEVAVLTPTPTLLPTPKPTPLALSELIPTKNQIVISSTQNFENTLKNEIKNISVSAGSFIALEIFDENQNKYTIADFFAHLDISIPGVVDSLDGSDWALLVYGQNEMFNNRGLLSFNQTPESKIGLIIKLYNSSSARNYLNNWETTMTEELKGLFEINPKKATSETFLDNIYGGTDIRYRNFPFADNTIDYAIVNLTEFNTDYFILAGSRESIYSTIDLLQAQ